MGVVRLCTNYLGFPRKAARDVIDRDTEFNTTNEDLAPSSEFTLVFLRLRLVSTADQGLAYTFES